MDPFGYLAADSATRQSVRSALPDASTVPERPPRLRNAYTAARAGTAQLLHHLADRLEPQPAPTRAAECA